MTNGKRATLGIFPGETQLSMWPLMLTLQVYTEKSGHTRTPGG